MILIILILTASLVLIIYQICTVIEYPFGTIESKLRIVTNGAYYRVQEKCIIGWANYSSISHDDIESAERWMKYVIKTRKENKQTWRPV